MVDHRGLLSNQIRGLAPWRLPSAGMILIAGEALVDLLVDPAGEVRAALGGGPFNAARTVARLGHPCGFVGRLSADRFGRRLTAALNADGVEIAVADPCDEPTTLAAAELDERGAASYRFYMANTSATLLRTEHMPDGTGVDAVHVGSLALVLEPIATTLLSWLRSLEPDVLVMVDLNARPRAISDAEHYRARLQEFAACAHIVKASTEDLEFLNPGEPPAASAQRMVDSGVAVVLLTDGGNPVHLVTASGVRAVPVPTVDVVDTVGAGDAFGAATLTALIDGGFGPAARRAGDDDTLDALVAAARFGARVSAITCTRTGADPPWRVDVEPG